MTDEHVLGIDFGTSYTTAGAFVGGRVDLVQDAGDVVIPTVAYVPERGAFEIGRAAQMRLLKDPSGVVRSIKRVLGAKASDPAAKRFMAQSTLRAEAVDDQVRFKLRSATYAPEQIAAAILTHVRDLAERRFGGRISKAVITMSAAADAGYREAIVRAARIAHLEVLALVPEPIAGALAVGMHAELADRKLLVCDFGGGTFDVSAVVQSGLRFSSVATAGDAFLGGDDLDDAIAEGIAGSIMRRAKFDIHRDAVRWSELRFRAEMAKRQLSEQIEAPLAMRDAYIEAGEPRSLDLRLERTWVEGRWAPLFDRMAATIDLGLARAGWAREDVDRVALIGGTTIVPMVQRTIATLFPEDRIVRAAHADIAVAQGAVLLTARYARGSSGNVPVLQAA